MVLKAKREAVIFNLKSVIDYQKPKEIRRERCHKIIRSKVRRLEEEI